jgi:hypothetical protein
MLQKHNSILSLLSRLSEVEENPEDTTQSITLEYLKSRIEEEQSQMYQEYEAVYGPDVRPPVSYSALLTMLYVAHSSLEQTRGITVDSFSGAHGQHSNVAWNFVVRTFNGKLSAQANV